MFESNFSELIDSSDPYQSHTLYRGSQGEGGTVSRHWIQFCNNSLDYLSPVSRFIDRTKTVTESMTPADPDRES